MNSDVINMKLLFIGVKKTNCLLPKYLNYQIVWLNLKVIIISLVTSILWISIAKAENFWKPATLVDLAQAQEEIWRAAKIDKTLLHRPMILAYKTALYLATRSMGTAIAGQEQKIFAKFGKGEEPYSEAVVTGRVPGIC